MYTEAETAAEMLYPGLYEVLVTMMQTSPDTEEQCEAAEDAESLLRLVKPRASHLAACARDVCAYHPRPQRLKYSGHTVPTSMRAPGCTATTAPRSSAARMSTPPSRAG